MRENCRGASRSTTMIAGSSSPLVQLWPGRSRGGAATALTWAPTSARPSRAFGLEKFDSDTEAFVPTAKIDRITESAGAGTLHEVGRPEWRQVVPEVRPTPPARNREAEGATRTGTANAA